MNETSADLIPESLAPAPPQPSAVTDCWRRIGVSGDGSCPELKTYVHCRNCPVMTAAARTFFDRPPPSGYLEDWAGVLGDVPGETTVPGTSTLVFRLSEEWYALPTEVLTEVASLRPVHRVPHRSSAALAGLVNVRGQLLLCGSLHGLLGLSGSPTLLHAAMTALPGERGGHREDQALLEPGRLLVAAEGRDRAARRWAFAVDQVGGAHRVAKDELRGVPATLGKAGRRFSQALFTWREQDVSLLEPARVFEGLTAGIPQ